MSLPIITRANKFINTVCGCAVILAGSTASADWAIDLSRRQKDIRQQEMKAPIPQPEQQTFFDKLFTAEAPANDVVILNTDKGFIPGTVRLRKGVKYKVHVVNVNGAEKNVSFILDAFSEHHATFYGSIKSFEIHPQKEGVFSFQCPETSLEGRMVVFQAEGETHRPAVRFPASE